MRFTLLFLLLVIHNIVVSPCAEHEWTRFKKRFNKVYASVEEERLRFDIFKDKMDYIDRHNKAGKSFTLGINQFADLSWEELKERSKGGKRIPTERKGATFLPPNNVKIPDHVDWRTKGYVTAVKDHGMCYDGDWAFVAAEVLEGQHFRKTGQLVALSAQNLIDCGRDFFPSLNSPCLSGVNVYGIEYVILNNGINSEKTYPQNDQSNSSCLFKRNEVAATAKGYVMVDSMGNEDILKVAVATVGPIAVYMDGYPYSFNYYQSGVYESDECCSTYACIQQSMLVVGYGTYKGQDYWLLKNSWGKSWGMEGYIMVARNKNNMCGVATWPVYALV